jgi:hypothetical protein
VENWFRLADAGAPEGKSMSVLLALVEGRIPVLTAGMAAAGGESNIRRVRVKRRR